MSDSTEGECRIVDMKISVVRSNVEADPPWYVDSDHDPDGKVACPNCDAPPDISVDHNLGTRAPSTIDLGCPYCGWEQRYGGRAFVDVLRLLRRASYFRTLTS